MLAVLTVLIMLGVGCACWRGRLLRAWCLLVNVLLAGLLAFGFWEPLADALDPALGGLEDFLVLVVLFAAALTLLWLVTARLAPGEPDLPRALRRGGAVFFGVLAGYLLGGFLLCAAQTLPLPERFLGFEARVEPGAAGEGLRPLLPPDRVWLALMHRAGAGPFARAGGPTFDPHGNFELRYARYRRKGAEGRPRNDDGAAPAR